MATPTPKKPGMKLSPAESRAMAERMRAGAAASVNTVDQLRDASSAKEQRALEDRAANVERSNDNKRVSEVLDRGGGPRQSTHDFNKDVPVPMTKGSTHY